MSRNFDRAQEMVVASMEYIKVLGFRIRRTEVQRDDWKQVAQSHADEMIKLRQHVDALKAERDAEREALGIQAAKEAGKVLGMVEGEGLRGAAERVIKERDALRAECDDLRRVFSLVHGSLGIQQGEHIGNAIDALKKERDELATRLRQSIGVVKERAALRAECDDLRRVFALVHGSLGIQQGEHIGNAIDALKKERDELATRLRQSIARGDFAEMRLATLAAELETERERHKTTPAPRTHPVKVGEYVKNDNGDVCQVREVHAEYLLTNGWSWDFEHCTPYAPGAAGWAELPPG